MPAPRQDEKAQEMYALYQRGLSIAQVAQAFGVTRQSVFKMFARRGYQLRSVGLLPFIIWGGHKYTRGAKGYYRRTNNHRVRLHRDVWEASHERIPIGYDVHHKDGDLANNSIENLELLTSSEHGRRHGFGGNQHTGSLGRRGVR